MTTEIQDFQLKYADTVLAIHVYVRAHQDVDKLLKSVFRAAKGPRLDAFAAWTKIYQPGQEIGAETSEFGDQRAQIEEFLRASKEEVVVIHLYVNTDADPKKTRGEHPARRAGAAPRRRDVCHPAL